MGTPSEEEVDIVTVGPREKDPRPIRKMYCGPDPGQNLFEFPGNCQNQYKSSFLEENCIKLGYMELIMPFNEF